MELDGPRREIYPSRKIWFGWSSTGCNGSLLSIVWRWKVSIARYLLRSDRESILTGWKLIYRDFDFHRVSFRLPPFIGFRSSLSFAFYFPLIFFSFFFPSSSSSFCSSTFTNGSSSATTQESSICRFDESDTTFPFAFYQFLTLRRSEIP